MQCSMFSMDYVVRAKERFEMLNTTASETRTCGCPRTCWARIFNAPCMAQRHPESRARHGVLARPDARQRARDRDDDPELQVRRVDVDWQQIFKLVTPMATITMVPPLGSQRHESRWPMGTQQYNTRRGQIKTPGI